MKKIKPGICGICGVAVVQPEEINVGWKNGHLFECKLKPNQIEFTELVLVRVRCMQHKENDDHRHYDNKGILQDNFKYCSCTHV